MMACAISVHAITPSVISSPYLIGIFILATRGTKSTKPIYSHAGLSFR